MRLRFRGRRGNLPGTQPQAKDDRHPLRADELAPFHRDVAVTSRIANSADEMLVGNQLSARGDAGEVEAARRLNEKWNSQGRHLRDRFPLVVRLNADPYGLRLRLLQHFANA